jgi:hypothetical protein
MVARHKDDEALPVHHVVPGSQPGSTRSKPGQPAAYERPGEVRRIVARDRDPMSSSSSRSTAYPRQPVHLTGLEADGERFAGCAACASPTAASTCINAQTACRLPCLQRSTRRPERCATAARSWSGPQVATAGSARAGRCGARRPSRASSTTATK